MNSNKLWIFCFFALWLAPYSANSKAMDKRAETAPAKELVRSAAEAMGGEAKLRALKTVKIEGYGHWNLLEQSERPEGPWIVVYDQISEFRDLEQNRLKQVSEGRSATSPEPFSFTLTVSENIAAGERNGKSFPLTLAQVQDVEEWFLLAPNSALPAALAAADLRTEKDVLLQGVKNHVVTWTWQNSPMRLFINSDTQLPTAVELIRPQPYDTFWSVWGDVRTRVYFSLWTLEPGGIHYPRQTDLERNGFPYRTLIISKLTLNADLPADSFSIAPEVRAAFPARGTRTLDDTPLGRPDKPAQDLADGIVQIPGAWNVALVRQKDGVVVIEAPISNGYSAKVIAEVERRFPNLPIKAVISTSDAFPHIGGVRAYVARGIPVYALNLNRPILQRLIDAPHRQLPDQLAKSPRKPDWRIVSKKTVIGDSDDKNRLEIYPIRSETGERMMMVYLPEHKLLYGSDLVQAQPDGKFFMPQYLFELKDAVRREQLEVNNVFAMHTTLTSWNKIIDAIVQASADEAKK